MPETGAQGVAGDATVRQVTVGGVETFVRSEENVADLFRRVNGRLGGLEIDMHHTALFHAEDVRDDGDPAVDDRVPGDLSTVEDGDRLRTFRLRAADRPAYMEAE